MSKTVVATFYKFVPLDDAKNLRVQLSDICNKKGVKGTILLATEGVNATIAGSRDAIDSVLAMLKSDSRFADLEHKQSLHDEMPFLRMKVKLRREIVTLGVEDIDPLKDAGVYVPAKEWNTVISDPDVLVIDTRNDYEYAVGSFKGAVNPKTKSFREFPNYVQQQLDPQTHQKVAMFCTGGIRCEKATAFMRRQGFEEVYHLRGGILKYLEEVPASESLWEGECFVFDERVAVDHRLKKGHYRLCQKCGNPVSDGNEICFECQ